jgi:hypothetical protein
LTNLNGYILTVFDIVLNGPVRGYRQPHDYMMVYYDHSVDSSVAVDSFGVQSVPIQFEVYDQTIGKKLKVIYVPQGQMSEAVFIENVAGVNRYTWDLVLQFKPPDTMPGGGDTLYVFTKKGLSFYDSYKISGNVLSVITRRALPSTFHLSQNYPNPFNPSTTMQYELSANARVRLKVYDILGREVKTLVDDTRPAGSYSVTWDGTNASGLPIASGIYFCRVEMNSLLPSGGSYTAVRKMLFIR